MNAIRRTWIAAGAVSALAAAQTSASVEQPAAGIVFREVIMDGTAHRVALRVPADYDGTRPWPLVVFLHGSGECGTDGVRQTQVGLGPAMAARPEQWPCLALMPQKPSEAEEWEEHEDLVLAAVADVRASFNIDPDRIALTGLSQGGHGVWVLGARHPDLFSCLAPVCGYGRVRTVAPRVAALPVWAFHGLRDDVVDPGETTAIIQGIRRQRQAAGQDPAGARLTLYPDAGHNSWDAAYAEPELPGWLLGQARTEGHP